MFTVELEWKEIDQIRSQTVDAQQAKVPGVVRVGRDPEQCDVVIDDPGKTVSRFHVELSFNDQTQALELRNLTQSQPKGRQNPAVVDGQTVLEQPIVLQVGSQLRLGQIDVALKKFELVTIAAELASDSTAIPELIPETSSASFSQAAFSTGSGPESHLSVATSEVPPTAVATLIPGAVAPEPTPETAPVTSTPEASPESISTPADASSVSEPVISADPSPVVPASPSSDPVQV